MKTKISQPPYVGLEWGGVAGQYSPGAPSTLTQIVHYSSSYYTVFQSVIYNSVVNSKENKTAFFTTEICNKGNVFFIKNVWFLFKNKVFCFPFKRNVYLNNIL